MSLMDLPNKAGDFAIMRRVFDISQWVPAYPRMLAVSPQDKPLSISTFYMSSVIDGNDVYHPDVGVPSPVLYVVDVSVGSPAYKRYSDGSIQPATFLTPSIATQGHPNVALSTVDPVARAVNIVYAFNTVYAGVDCAVGNLIGEDSGIFFFSMVQSFQRLELANPLIQKDFTINGYDAESYIQTVDEEFKPAEGEEVYYKGKLVGVRWRVIEQYGNQQQVGQVALSVIVGSFYATAVELGVYALTPAAEVFSTPILGSLPMSDIHPLFAQMTGQTKLYNTKYIHDQMTIGELATLLDITYLVDSSSVGHRFAPPRLSLFPPDNTGVVGHTYDEVLQASTFGQSKAYKEFAEYSLFILTSCQVADDVNVNRHTVLINSLYDSRPNFFANGVQLADSYTVDSNGIAQHKIVLADIINDVVVSPGAIDDPDASHMTIRVILDGLSASTTNYAQHKMVMAVDGTLLEPANLLVSYVDTTALAPYVNAYGQQVFPTTTPNSTTILAGPHIVELSLEVGGQVSFDKIQNYWFTGSSTYDQVFIEDGERTWIRASDLAVIGGIHDYYVSTVGGHITLRVTIVAPAAGGSALVDERTFYLIEGGQIDFNLSSPFYDPDIATLTHTPYLNAGILGHLQSSNPAYIKQPVKFSLSSLTMNVEVVPPPIRVETFRVRIGSNYHLKTLLKIDPRFKTIDFRSESTDGSSVTTLNSIAGWATWPIGSVTGQVFVSDVLVANIVAVDIPMPVPTPIFARMNKPFSIWPHLGGHSLNDILVSVDNPPEDMITVDPAGNVRIGVSLLTDPTEGLKCTLSLMGVEVQFTGLPGSVFPVTIISQESVDWFVTRDYRAKIPVAPNMSLVLIGASGQHVITAAAISSNAGSYTSTELNITTNSPNYDIEVLQECLLLVKDADSKGTDVEIHFVPFGRIDTRQRLLVKDVNGDCTLELPHGPQYDIAGITSPTNPFNGGSLTFSPPSSDVTVTCGNYDDGITFELKIVEGEVIKQGLVQSFTIPNVTSPAGVAFPSYASISGSDIVITNSTNANFNQPIVVQDGSLYKQYMFEVIPQVKTSQVIYFTKAPVIPTSSPMLDQKYHEVLPLANYAYFTQPGNVPLDLTLDITAPTTVTWSYGELTGNTRLIHYSGASQTVEIYLNGLVQSSEMHRIDSSGKQGEIVSLPFEKGGVQFSISGINIAVQKSRADLDIDQYFFIEAGVATLVSFQNLPEITHPDVYVFPEINGLNTYDKKWKADKDITSPETGLLNVGQYVNFLTISPTTTEILATVVFLPTDPYFGTTLQFRIIDTVGAGKVVPLNVIRSKDYTFANPILGYTTQPPNMIKHNGSAKAILPNCHVSIGENSIAVRNTSPHVKLSESELYIRTVDGTFIVFITTRALPYADNSIMEFFEGAPLTLPAIAGVSNVSLPTLLPGSNVVSYRFHSEPLAPSFFTTTITAKVIPLPKAVDTNRIMQTGETLQIDLLNELFGEKDNYRLVSVLVQEDTGAGLIPATDLNGTITPQGQIRLTSNGSTAKSYELDVTIDATISMNLANTTIMAKIYIITWNPATTPHEVFYTNPGVALNGQGLTPGLGLLKAIFYEGKQLTGIKYEALNWMNFNDGTIDIYSAKETVLNFFIHTTRKVIFLSIIVLEALTATMNFLIPFGDTTARFNLLKSFYPLLADQLIDAGVSSGPAPPLGNTFTDYELVGGVNGGIQLVVPVTAGTLSLSQLNYNCIIVQPPTIIGSTSFTIPWKKAFEVKSSDISPDSILTLKNPSLLNFNKASLTPSGISVLFTTTELTGYDIECILTRDGVESVPLNLTFTVYDPSDTIKHSVTTFSGTASKKIYTPDNQIVTSSDVASYSVDGVEYGLESPIVINGLNTITISPADTINVIMDVKLPKMTIVAKLVNGQIAILFFNYIVIGALDTTIYLLKDEVRTISASDISDVVVSALVQFNNGPPFIFNNGTSGFEVLNQAGDLVGYIVNGVGFITLKGGVAGVWDGIAFEITVGVPAITSTIFPRVETLAALAPSPATMIIDKGTALNVNANEYIFSGVSEVSFKDWLMNGSPLPPYVKQEKGVLRVAEFNTVGSYIFTATVKSGKHAGLTDTFTLTVLVIDPSDTDIQEVIVIKEQAGSTTLSDKAITVNGTKLTSTTLRLNNIELSFGASPTNLLTIKALTELSDTFTFDIVTADAKKHYITVRQVDSEKSLTVFSGEYSGTLFKKSSATVVSFTIQGKSGLFYPNQLIAFPPGSLQINGDGSFVLQDLPLLKITVSYVTTTNGPQLLLPFEIGGNKHPDVTIEQTPPPRVSLGSGTLLKVMVLGIDLVVVGSKDFGYATFTLNGNDLLITNITDDFVATLVQAELELSNEIQVISKMIDINRDTNSQLIYEVGKTSQVRFILPFTPAMIKFDGQKWSGSNVKDIEMHMPDSIRKFGMFSISGTSLTIQSFDLEGISRPIGFTNAKGFNTYAIVKVVSPSSITKQDVKPSDVIFAGSDSSGNPITFTAIGKLDDSSKVVTSTVSPNNILEDRVKNTGASLQILATITPVSSYTFYATLSNGGYRIYTIAYRSANITVSDLTRIPNQVFLGDATGTLVFLESSVVPGTLTVSNPNSLRTLTMTSPLYGKFNLSLRIK